MLGGLRLVVPAVRRPGSGRRLDAGDVSESMGGAAELRRPLATLHVALSNRIHDVPELRAAAAADDLARRARRAGDARPRAGRRPAPERPRRGGAAARGGAAPAGGL